MPDPTWQALYRAALVQPDHKIERPHRSRPTIRFASGWSRSRTPAILVNINN
jgi:hypothetical protein